MLGRAGLRSRAGSPSSHSVYAYRPLSCPETGISHLLTPVLGPWFNEHIDALVSGNGTHDLVAYLHALISSKAWVLSTIFDDSNATFRCAVAGTGAIVKRAY